MKRFYIILLALCIIIPNAFSQHKKAFMVGISHYDNATTNYEWNNIHGVEDIKLISPLLKSQGFAITEVLDEQATYSQIKSRLTKFSNSIKKGDIIYIHFSMHGQPFEDKDGDETDKWDESLVPYDAFKKFQKGKYEGSHHLIDDELNKYFNTIRKKAGETGCIYVVIDACHAGTSSRGEDTTRGTMIGFTSNPRIQYNPPMEHRNSYIISTAQSFSPITFIEACRSDQINRELKTKEGMFGALSYNIAQVLQTMKISDNRDQFINALKQSVKRKGLWPQNQNMVIETSR